EPSSFGSWRPRDNVVPPRGVRPRALPLNGTRNRQAQRRADTSHHDSTTLGHRGVVVGELEYHVVSTGCVLRATPAGTVRQQTGSICGLLRIRKIGRAHV